MIGSAAAERECHRCNVGVTKKPRRNVGKENVHSLCRKYLSLTSVTHVSLLGLIQIGMIDCRAVTINRLVVYKSTFKVDSSVQVFFFKMRIFSGFFTPL